MTFVRLKNNFAGPGDMRGFGSVKPAGFNDALKLGRADFGVILSRAAAPEKFFGDNIDSVVSALRG
jgi:hypothetical protein